MSFEGFLWIFFGAFLLFLMVLFWCVLDLKVFAELFWCLKDVFDAFMMVSVILVCGLGFGSCLLVAF